jgi:hypothetical protein
MVVALFSGGRRCMLGSLRHWGIFAQRVYCLSIIDLRPNTRIRRRSKM